MFCFLELNKESISSYSIDLNYLCGENIRISICCTSDNAETLSVAANEFFKEFYTKNDFPEKNIHLPIDGLFLPFQCNTIQYGLHKKGYHNSVDFQLSNMIVEVLADDVIDDESILTFALYLHLGLLSQLDVELALIDLKSYNMDTESNLIDKELLYENYALNKVSFNEIYSDIFNRRRESLEDTSPWLDDWLQLCASELNSGGIIENKFGAVYEITTIINNHLGFDDSMKQVLNNLINSLMADNLAS